MAKLMALPTIKTYHAVHDGSITTTVSNRITNSNTLGALSTIIAWLGIFTALLFLVVTLVTPIFPILGAVQNEEKADDSRLFVEHAIHFYIIPYVGRGCIDPLFSWLYGFIATRVCYGALVTGKKHTGILNMMQCDHTSDSPNIKWSWADWVRESYGDKWFNRLHASATALFRLLFWHLLEPSAYVYIFCLYYSELTSTDRAFACIVLVREVFYFAAILRGLCYRPAFLLGSVDCDEFHNTLGRMSSISGNAGEAELGELGGAIGGGGGGRDGDQRSGPFSHTLSTSSKEAEGIDGGGGGGGTGHDDNPKYFEGQRIEAMYTSSSLTWKTATVVEYVPFSKKIKVKFWNDKKKKFWEDSPTIDLCQVRDPLVGLPTKRMPTKRMPTKRRPVFTRKTSDIAGGCIGKSMIKAMNWIIFWLSPEKFVIMSGGNEYQNILMEFSPPVVMAEIIIPLFDIAGICALKVGLGNGTLPDCFVICYVVTTASFIGTLFYYLWAAGKSFQHHKVFGEKFNEWKSIIVDWVDERIAAGESTLLSQVGKYLNENGKETKKHIWKTGYPQLKYLIKGIDELEMRAVASRTTGHPAISLERRRPCFPLCYSRGHFHRGVTLVIIVFLGVIFAYAAVQLCSLWL